MLGIMWATHESIPTEEKMILNHIANALLEEAKSRGFETFIVKDNDDYKKLFEKGGYLLYPTFSNNEKSEYVPLQVHSLTTPTTDYSSGSITNYSTGNTYNYSGTTTSQKTTTYTTGGYTKTYHCRFISLNFMETKELNKEKPEVSYLMKTKSCGSNSDIRKVASEMIESAFNFLGEDGTFNQNVYLDVVRGSPDRYK